MDISVIGAGYVGLVTGVCLAEFGHRVELIDINPDRIRLLQNGVSPIFEPGIEPMIVRNTESKRLWFSDTLDGPRLNQCDVIFIAVSTPASSTGDADLSYLFNAVDQLIPILSSRTTEYPAVIAIKSTVPVGTNQLVQDRFNTAGLTDKAIVVSNPEFLREGAAISDCINPDRIVIGASCPEGFQRMKNIYHSYIARKIPILEVSLFAAEHIKYASNAFLATKISFINELALLCESTHTDVLEVARGMGLDPRIGPSFLAPGPGFGGSCFPKDIRALGAVGACNGLQMKMIESVEAINHRQKQHVITQIQDRIAGIKSPVIAVLGVAFKANTDDMRDAPSLDILPPLLKRGIRITAYDPEAESNAKLIFGDTVQFKSSPLETATGAHLLLILTEWNEFFDIDLYSVKRVMEGNLIVDTRRVIDPNVAAAAGFNYYGIGRA